MPCFGIWTHHVCLDKRLHGKLRRHRCVKYINMHWLRTDSSNLRQKWETEHYCLGQALDPSKTTFEVLLFWCAVVVGLWISILHRLVNSGRVDPGQPVDPLTRVDMFDPSLVKIDKFLLILMGWTGWTRPNLDPGTKIRPERVKFTSLARVEGVGAQSKERKGSNFAIWQPCSQIVGPK